VLDSLGRVVGDRGVRPDAECRGRYLCYAIGPENRGVGQIQPPAVVRDVAGAVVVAVDDALGLLPGFHPEIVEQLGIVDPREPEARVALALAERGIVLADVDDLALLVGALALPPGGGDGYLLVLREFDLRILPERRELCRLALYPDGFRPRIGCPQGQHQILVREIVAYFDQ